MSDVSTKSPGPLVRMRDARLPLKIRINSVREVLEAQKDTIFQALPKHVTPDRMIRAVLTSLRRNDKLLACTAESFFGAITEAAALGLEVDGVLGYAYLIPFKTECQLVPGYKGLIDLCRRSGTISTVTMEVVHDGDLFSYQLGDAPFIRHVPDDQDPDRDEKPITHVYAVVVLRDGGIQRKVWSRAKIEKHKERYSRAWSKSDSPWQTNWPAMAKKTVIRDMINRGEVPASVEIQRLAAREEIYEATIPSPTETAAQSHLDNLTDRVLAPPQKPASDVSEPPFNPPTPEEQDAAEDTQVDPAVDKAEGVDEATPKQERERLQARLEVVITLKAVDELKESAFAILPIEMAEMFAADCEARKATIRAKRGERSNQSADGELFPTAGTATEEGQ